MGNTGGFPSALNLAITLPKKLILGIACLDGPPMLYYEGCRLKAWGRACALETLPEGFQAMVPNQRAKSLGTRLRA